MIGNLVKAMVKDSVPFQFGFLNWGGLTYPPGHVLEGSKTMKIAEFAPGLRTTFCLLLLTAALGSLGRAQTPDSLNPTASNTIFAICVQTDGKILLGGNFTSVTGQPRKYLARLNSDGTLDNGFDPAPSGFVETLVVQPDGQILVGGGFLTIGGQTRWGIARLSAAGVVDPGFNAAAEYRDFFGMVHALALQANGQIVVGGHFMKLGGQWRTNIARLNVDGTVDPAFNPGAAGGAVGDVLSLCLQPDGKILAGGWFAALAGKPRNGFGRLDPSGALDAAFDPKPVGTVLAVAVQPDGQLIVGGTFTAVGGQSRNCIARLGTNGVADATFNPGASGAVSSIVLQADGRILVGGSFTNLAGQSRTNLGRLDQPGTPDATFDTSANDRVQALALQPDGKLLVGGDFTSLGGESRIRIGRLSNPEVATESLSLDALSITWLRGGSAPEAWRTSFDLSTNGSDWTSLGNGTRVPGGWQVTTAGLPADGFVRARGFVTSGEWSGSSWFVESVMNIAPAQPTILVNDGNFGFRSNGFGFNVSASSNQSVVLEASTNLVDWLGLTTNLIGTNPTYFNDPDTQWLPQRFYRVRLQ